MVSFRKTEFGDFQTPHALAMDVARFLFNIGVIPEHIVEPTCGLGTFIHAAHQTFPRIKSICGYDINSSYIENLVSTADGVLKNKASFEHRDFFEVNWDKVFNALPGNILVLGNPPWVTNSTLGVLESGNLPVKNNFQRLEGLSAKTGKANFDISEWMMTRLLETLHHRPGWLAMLCKTGAARKVLLHAWKNNLSISNASIHVFDARAHFNVSVDACLLVVETGKTDGQQTAGQYEGFTFEKKISEIGMVGGELVHDIHAYRQFQSLDGGSHYTWRSGIKHDAASIMEFSETNSILVNGNGETPRLEPEFLYPLLKSSDIANSRLTPRRHVLVTQKKPSDDTREIAEKAPRTWQYLLANADALDRRKSSIYQKRARFSVFGIGDYAFAPWKVVVSGLYKNCRFSVVGQHEKKPVMLDDTCYFTPCQTEREARFVCDMLNSESCQNFIKSLVFFDSKRPVTVDVLNRVNILRLAENFNFGNAVDKPFVSVDKHSQAIMVL